MVLAGSQKVDHKDMLSKWVLRKLNISVMQVPSLQTPWIVFT